LNVLWWLWKVGISSLRGNYTISPLKVG